MTGELLALVSTFAYAVASVAIAKNTRASTGESGVFLSAIATTIISGLGWITAGNGRNLHAAQFMSSAVAWFIVSGLLATVFGRLTFYKSIEYAGVVRAATSRRLTPFISLFIGWVLFGEKIMVVAAIGMALIGSSYLLLYRESRRKVQIIRDDDHAHGRVSYGLALGFVSAFLYAASYAARKFGLDLMPDSYLGAFSGALTAVVFFLGAAFASERYRTIFRKTLLSPPPLAVPRGDPDLHRPNYAVRGSHIYRDRPRRLYQFGRCFHFRVPGCFRIQDRTVTPSRDYGRHGAGDHRRHHDYLRHLNRDHSEAVGQPGATWQTFLGVYGR